MSTSVSSVTSHFPEAENGFTTTTSGSVSSGATTVGLNSTAGYTNGEPVVFVIDPTNVKKQTFTGIMDTGGSQVTGVIWTAGTNVTHDAGATVVDYATATHISMISKGIKVEHNQDGTHDEALITSRTEDTSPATGDFVLTADVSASNALKKVTVNNLTNAVVSSLDTGTVTSSVLTNPYKFSVYRSSAWNTPAGASAKVEFNSENFDTGSNYDNATNYRFTAPIAGFYHFSTGIYASGNTRLLVALYKNAGEIVRFYDSGSVLAAPLGGGSALVQLAASDYVEVFIFTSAAVAGGTAAAQTYFMGHLVSAT